MGINESIIVFQLLSTMAKVDSIDETDLDLVDVLNPVLPFEKHLPGMNYCGPGTNLNKKLMGEGITPRPEFLPVDRVDEVAFKHDLAYNKYDDLRHRLDADKDMIRELRNIKNPSCRERIERMIVIPIISIKRLVGNLYLRMIGPSDDSI